MKRHISYFLVCACLAMGVCYAQENTTEESEEDYTSIPVTVVDVQVPVVQVPTVQMPTVQMPTVEVPVVEITEVVVPQVHTGEERMKEWAAFLPTISTMFKDRRVSKYDPEVSPFSNSFSEWKKIYNEHRQYEMSHVPLCNGIRMVAEVRVPENEEQWSILDANLSFYSKQGYNSALLAISTKETNEDLRRVVRCIASHNMKLWFALSGKETLYETLFVSPEEIRRCFTMVALEAQGMLIGWRRTSVHLFEMDLEYADYLVSTARAVNPNLMVLGEGYYGETASSNNKTNKLTYNMPKNVSGCAMIGVGYQNVNARMATLSLFKSIIDVPKVALVVGEKPYYADGTGKSFLEHLKIKQDVEKRFTDAGCVGTITLHGDGSDKGTGLATDNISGFLGK